MLAAISQRHCVTENSVPDQRAEGPADDHLNGARQQLLKIRDQTAGKPWRRFSSDVDEDVDIAVDGFFSPRHRTEQPHVPCAVPCSYA